MGAVVEFVLGSGSRDEVVQGLHLGGHVFHLGVDYTDGFFVDGLSGGLDGGVVFVDGFPVFLHFTFQSVSGFGDFSDKEALFLRPGVHAGIVVFVCCC